MWEVDFKKGEHCFALLSTAAARRAQSARKEERKEGDISANMRTNLLMQPQGFYGVIQRL